MRRWIAVVSMTLGALAAAAGPASANLPKGKGLEDFGPVTCGAILGWFRSSGRVVRVPRQPLPAPVSMSL